MIYTKTINGKVYTIEIAPSITKVSFLHDNGLTVVYAFTTFVCEEKNKRINPHFERYFLSPATGEKIEIKETDWTVTEDDFNVFDATLGQIIRRSLVNGLFSYKLGLEKPFDPDNNYQFLADTEDGE